MTPRLLAQAIERLELLFPERGNLCGLHGFWGEIGSLVLDLLSLQYRLDV